MANLPHEQKMSWKTRAYLIGGAAGVLFGLLAAYLYARAAEEDVERGGGRPRQIGTGELIGLALAALGIARQIAEMGKGPKKR